MAEIYASADQVLIWLAPHPHIEHCLKLLDNRESFGTQLQVDLGFSETLSRTHALIDILRLEYWRRAWIVQEIALARQLKLKGASTTIPSARFLEASERLRSTAAGDSNDHDDLAAHAQIWLRRSNIGQSAMIVQKIQDLISDPKSFLLIQWLGIAQTQGCKDDRDRVYSLLGLYRLKTPLLLHPRFALPDYGKDAFLVQWDTVFMLLYNTAHVDQGRPIEVARQIAQILNLGRVERREYQSSRPGDEDIRISPDDLQQGMFARHGMPSFFPLLDSLVAYVLDKSADPNFQKLAESSLLAAVAIALSDYNYWKFDIDLTWKNLAANGTASLQQHESIAKAKLPTILGQLIALHDKRGAQIFADAVSNCEWKCLSCNAPLTNIWVFEQPIVHSHAQYLNNKDTCSECSAVRHTAREAAMQSHMSLMGTEWQMHGEYQPPNPTSPNDDMGHMRSNPRAGFFHMCFRNFGPVMKSETQYSEVRRIIWVRPGSRANIVTNENVELFDTPSIDAVKRLPFMFLDFHVSKGAPVIRSVRKLLNRSATSGRIGALTQIRPDRRCGFGCKGPYPWITDNRTCRSWKRQSFRKARVEKVLKAKQGLSEQSTGAEGFGEILTSAISPSIVAASIASP